jgi:hypothetical protein
MFCQFTNSSPASIKRAVNKSHPVTMAGQKLMFTQSISHQRYSTVPKYPTTFPPSITACALVWQLYSLRVSRWTTV